MIKVGITGQSGFIGTHLYNTLGLYPEKFTRIPFEDSFFNDEKKLKEFVSQCEAIVHLAAMNRHNDPEVIYETNIRLVTQLTSACTAANSTPHILFSSSTQEERDNLYGKSKKEGRELLEQWALSNNAKFTGLVIPNVFGPFGHPYYNSFIATFCHQLTHGEEPKIETDGQVKLIYVNELVETILNIISENQNSTQMTQIEQMIADKNSADQPNQRHQRSIITAQISPISVISVPSKNSENPPNPRHPRSITTIHVPHTSEVKVSETLNLLKSYKENYFDKGIIPCLDDTFNKNLFNTFVCYIDHADFFPFHLKLNTDDRGSFVETVKLHSGGQVSFSTTKPGITRGNHFHTRKAERFAVIKGKASIELRRIGTDKVLTFDLDGSQPSFVDMPIWYTHNITNTGDEELYTIFWINEHFNANDPDTFFEKV